MQVSNSYFRERYYSYYVNLKISDFPDPRDPPPSSRSAHETSTGSRDLQFIYVPAKVTDVWKMIFLANAIQKISPLYKSSKYSGFTVFTVEVLTFIKTKLYCGYTVDGRMRNYLSKRRRRWCTWIWLDQIESRGGGVGLEGGGGTNQKSYNLLKFLRLRRVNFFSFPVSHSLGLCITRADKFCNFNLIKSTQLCLIYMKVNI